MFKANNIGSLVNEAVQNIIGITNIVTATPVSARKEDRDEINPFFLEVYLFSLTIIFREENYLRDHEQRMVNKTAVKMSNYLIDYYKQFPKRLKDPTYGTTDILRFYESTDTPREGETNADKDNQQGG